MVREDSDCGAKVWFDYVCLGECYYWQEDLVSVQYARPGEPDRAGLSAALRKHTPTICNLDKLDLLHLLLA